MINAFRIILLTLFLALAMAGCAEMAPMADMPAPKSAVVPPPAPTLAPVLHEPGAIWSENSKWNDLYAGNSGRGPGDLILVKPTDSFKLAIASRIGKGAATPEGPSVLGKENSYLVVAIKEVLPRNTYSITAHQMLKSGSKEHELMLQGKLREQDIGTDDSVSSDLIFDMALDVKGNEPDVTPKIANHALTGGVAPGAPSADKKDDSEKGEMKK